MNSAPGTAAYAVLTALLSRRSVRSFEPTPVPDATLAELLEAARWAPSADNGQPWYIVVVRQEATRRRLNAIGAESRALYELWESETDRPIDTLPDFLEVPLGLAFFADPRQSPAYVEGELGHVLATGMAIQNVWLAAEARGLAGCLWAHLEQDQVKTILGVPHHYYFAGVLGLGFPARERTAGPRTRKALTEIVGYEWFKVGPGTPPPADKLALLQEFLRT